MAEVKKASLTVLGGSLAGARAPLPHDGVVTLGSAADSTLHLDSPSVSPRHARIVLEGGQATVHAAGTDRPVHVNDSPLGPGGATLRNGDILWLGVPGEDDVVMLQCILTATAPPPPAPAAARAVPTPEIETTALWTTPPPPSSPESPPDVPGARRTGDEPTIAFSPERVAPPPEPVDTAEAEPEEAPLVIALDTPQEDAAVVVDEPDLVTADEIAPVTFDESDEAVVVDEDELFAEAAPTFVGVREDIEAYDPEGDVEETIALSSGPPSEPPAPEPPKVDEATVAITSDDLAEPPPPPVVVPEPPSPAPEPPGELPVAEFVDDDLPEVDPLPMPAEPSPPAEAPGVAPPPPEPPAPPTPPLPNESAPTVSSPASPDASSPPSSSPPQASSPRVGLPPTPPPSASQPSAPRPPDASAPAARPPDRSTPSHPAASQRRRPAPVRPAPPPEEPLDDEYDEYDEDEEPGRSPVLLAVAGFAGVLLVAALGWAVWRFVLTRPSLAPTPVPVAAATAAPPPVSATPVPPVAEPTPEAPLTADASAPTPVPTPVPTPTPAPPAAAPEPQPTPTPEPAVAPTPTPTPPPAPVAAAPPQPSAEEQQAQQRAQQVQTLLGQGDAALAAADYDAAMARFNEVLTLDPQNSRARSSRARALGLRDLARRKFVPTRTRVQTEKEQEGGIAGFDMGDADLRKTPDFQGRIEFEMSPATGIKAGDPWSLRIFVVNEGEKPIRIQGVETATQVNGTGSAGSVPPQTRQVPTQQRLLVGEHTGTWTPGTNAWSTQVTVTANKGDSLRATLTWK